MNNKLTYYSDCIVKEYVPEAEYNNLSCPENEIFTLEKFSAYKENPYCPIVLRMDSQTYVIERYSFALGEAILIHKNNVKRMLFSISFREFEDQINEILEWLDRTGLKHRDFNPSNLIFYEKEKRIKLIDFYWSRTDGITVGRPGQLNWFYGEDDVTAARKIIEDVRKVNDEIKNAINNEIIPVINKIGSGTYYDGSSVDQGIVYHPISIPDIAHRSVVNSYDLFNDIIRNISIHTESIIDVGAAVGYFTFGLMRHCRLEKAYCYEADPNANELLKKIKTTYQLNELEILNGVGVTTDFPYVDVSLMLNVHMWLYKQLGREGCDLVTSNLIKKSRQMFFQTSGSESAGMYNLLDKEFSSKEEIEKYLYSLGAKKVYYIKTEPIHGKYRHLFKIEGK